MVAPRFTQRSVSKRRGQTLPTDEDKGKWEGRESGRCKRECRNKCLRGGVDIFSVALIGVEREGEGGS